MIGILNSKAMDDNGVMIARIDEKSYKVLSYVLPFLDKIETGTQVEVNITQDDRISKINRVRKEQRDPETAQKMNKAGFGEPQTQSAEQIKKEHDEYNARARGTPTDKPGVTDVGGDAVKAPAGGIAGIVAATKAKAQEEKKDCTSSGTPAQCTQVATVPFSNDQINLIKATVARNCTNTEFELLMYLSAQYGLDPIRRQIWAVKYGDAPASIFTGRDGFLEIAHRSGVFDGMESGIRQEGDEIIGWARVYRKDMAHAFYVEVYLKEYTTGKNLWQTKPRIMIQKVAESSCLRRAFSVSGLYCPEEMPEQGGA